MIQILGYVDGKVKDNGGDYFDSLFHFSARAEARRFSALLASRPAMPSTV